MYAVMQSQDELADIIYEFSNIACCLDERETTLQQELKFCRKYSYLCMVRYPNPLPMVSRLHQIGRNEDSQKFTLNRSKKTTLPG